MYYDRLCDLGIKLTRRNGSEKTKCPQCSDGRKNKTDKPLSVSIANGDYRCFSFETRVLTKYGVFPIGELAGKEAFVLNGNREWVKVLFSNYGKTELYKISLTRNGRKKDIYATANHQWFARNKVRELTTADLLPGQRLTSCFPEYMQDYMKDSEAIIAGLIFGDGTIYNRHRKKQFSKATLYGDKDSQFRYLFSGRKIKENKGYCQISGFPPEYKTKMPSTLDDTNYILSWLAGYFAADGDVSENGVPCINSSNYSKLLHLRDLCTKSGIGTYGISKYYRKGIKDRYSDIYRLNFIPETVHESLFLNKKHKERFTEFCKKFSRKRWMVVSVEKTDRYEEVFCCVEPDTHQFTLEDNILTGNCHNCGWKGNVRSFERKRDYKTYEKPDQQILKNRELRDKVIGWFNQRAISEDTLNKFMVFCREEWMPQTQKKENCICFPYFRDGVLVNVKYRDGRKNFRMVKDAELILFNMQGIGARKKCILVEGEPDCMAVYEAGFGQDYEEKVNEDGGEITVDSRGLYVPLSVPNGASKGNQKLEYLDNCSEYLLDMEEIIIATDGDEAGEMLKEELSIRLGIEKCKFIIYPYEEVVPTPTGKRRCKDLNEVLLYLGKEAVVSCIENAQSWPIDGIHYIEDIFPSMLENFKKGIQMAPKTHFGEMDMYFRWKKGDINLWVGYANHGKTTFVLQLMLTKSVNDGWRWAIFSPENYPANDFFDDLVEMYIGKWLDNISEGEYTEACHFINDHFFYVYPEHEHDLNSIQEKFRYLVLKKGVDGVMIDPFNQLDRSGNSYQREDLYLSDQLKDVKRFALLNRVSYNIIAHPVKMQRDSDKSYPPVDMYDIAGGAMFANKSDQIISYYRPNHHVDKTSPEVKILIQKVKRKRTGGQQGDFDIRMDWKIKRYVDVQSGRPFLNPKIEAKPKSVQIQSRIPYIDIDDKDDLIDEMPF